MIKRIFACAAILICLAASALAGGAQEKQEYFRKPDGESAWDAYVYGENMPGVYTYGGSKRDWVHNMAVAPDGRIAITGYTESSDGTLSDRTKTWRAGWVMMLDKDMNVQWNYCSRSGDADHMRFPVFHEDGTLSVVHETEGKQLKIVTIDEYGERKDTHTVMSGKREDGMYYVVGATQAGYMIAETENYGERVTYTIFDFKGTKVWQSKEFASIRVVGATDFIGRKDGDFSRYALPGGRGPEKEIAPVYVADADGRTLCGYDSMISFEDGGAAACGSAWEAYDQGRQGETGLISCWDAQGNVVFEMHVVGGSLKSLVRTEEGFACLRIAKNEADEEIWELVRFDEKGILCGTQKLMGTPSRDVGCVAVCEDGTILCAQMTGLFGEEDVHLTVIEAK